MVKVVGVKFKDVGKVYDFDPNGFEIEKDMNVIVETARGIECGTVAVGVTEIAEEKLVQPLKKVIRIATEEDMKRVFEEYDAKNHISMPPISYFKELEINEYNDHSGYWVDIDLFYNNQISDLTLQLDFRKNGKVIIDDLHVL